jgi:membrane protein implicated in regulation of membrane protease activity
LRAPGAVESRECHEVSHHRVKYSYFILTLIPMSVEWWICLAFVIVGIILYFIEAHTPGFFIAIPATVLIILGFVGLAVPGFISTPYGLVLAIIITVPSIIVTMKLYQKLAPPKLSETTIGSSLIGRVGIVTREVEPDNIKGKVKIDSEMWSATSEVNLPVGMKVTVTGSEGVHVIVEKVVDGKKVKEGI